MSLKSISGEGWVRAQPPSLDASENALAVVDGFEVRAAPEFEMKESPIIDTPEKIHRKFRSGVYDLEVMLNTTTDMAVEGYVRVERADGY